MIQYKTAVLVAGDENGALVAASVENADLIYEFGLNLGAIAGRLFRCFW
jgi:hypothetical protein